jgi:hypothetical protein
MARGIELPIIIAWRRPVDPGRDHRDLAGGCQWLKDARIGVERLVGEPRARSRATGRLRPPRRDRRTSSGQRAGTERTCAPLPVLWRPDDHHRDLRARMPTTLSTFGFTRRRQDRHLMTLIADWPQCRAELACRSSATGRANARRFRQHCRQGTPVTAAFSLRLHHQPDLPPLADHPTNSPNASPACPCGPVAAAKSP